MVTTKSLSRRITALEEDGDERAPAGALPVILADHEFDSPKAARLRALGYAVMTFEQCAEAMV